MALPPSTLATGKIFPAVVIKRISVPSGAGPVEGDETRTVICDVERPSAAILLGSESTLISHCWALAGSVRKINVINTSTAESNNRQTVL